MKTFINKLSPVSKLFLLIGAFVLSQAGGWTSVHAAVPYEQTYNSEGEIDLILSDSYKLLGTFSLSEPTDFSEAVVQLQVRSEAGFCHSQDHLYVDILNEARTINYISWAPFGYEPFGSDMTDEFRTYTLDSDFISVQGGGSTLPEGEYRIEFHSQCNFGSGAISVRANSLNNLFYGYIATNGETPLEDLSTRVVQIYPNDGETIATSTEYVLEALINVNSEEWTANDDWFVRFKYVRQQNLQAAVANTELLWEVIDIPITSWPAFDFVQATTSITDIGEYIYKVELRTPSTVNTVLNWFNLGNLFDPGLRDRKEGRFIAVERTALDQFMYDMASSTAAFIEDPGIFSGVQDNCNPISGFSAVECISALFVPSQSFMLSSMEATKENILSKVPLGYVTRVVDIMSTTTASTTPPGISYTFEDTPLEGQTIAFDFFGSLTEASTIVEDTLVSNTVDEKNVWEILMPVINPIIYLFLLFMIINDITGIHRHPSKKETA